MLHNKDYWVIREFLGDYQREVYGRGLLGKVPLSQKAIALTLDELEKKGILSSRKQGNMKYFKLNLRGSEIKDVLVSAEIMKKIVFFDKYRKIAQVFTGDERVVGIFGGYAKERATSDSDIDVFVIGGKKGGNYEEKGRAFDLKISIKYFSEETFKELMRKKNPLCKEIIENHVLIFGAERFVSLAWRDYYGFS